MLGLPRVPTSPNQQSQPVSLHSSSSAFTFSDMGTAFHFESRWGIRGWIRSSDLSSPPPDRALLSVKYRNRLIWSEASYPRLCWLKHVIKGKTQERASNVFHRNIPVFRLVFMCFSKFIFTWNNSSFYELGCFRFLYRWWRLYYRLIVSGVD